MSYAFTFDAKACTGCKACQVACKDKNGLPVGLLWRRVIEVVAGEWQATANAWENNVIAYNLTIACNHCTHPKCAGVCPTDAFNVRVDGVVLIQGNKCMGCGYCSWACPYGAPQYDIEQGIMTKCDFCYDNLDAGLPPSCVSACPLRVLDYGTLEELQTSAQGKHLWLLPATEHPFPLPDFSRTEPHLTIKAHPAMNSPLEKTVSNQEEILLPQSFEKRQRGTGTHELPLVAFTLLTQMAAGMAVLGLLLSSIPLPVLLAIGILPILGGSISFLHLGRKRNAWRSIAHLKKSWLSREVLTAGIFVVTWVVTLAMYLFWKVSPNPWPLAILGSGLVYCMSRVYLLRAAPPWNTWRTPTAFFLSTAVLGSLGVRLIVQDYRLLLVAFLAMAGEMGLALTERPLSENRASILHFALTGLAMMGALLSALLPQDFLAQLILLVFVIALAAEAVGRWQFYTRRISFPIAPSDP